MTVVFTIGHSTRPLEEFVDLLKTHGVERLVDIRTVPRSRHNPQYEQTTLEKSMPKEGVEYVYLKALGGLRPKVEHSVNMGWHNESFRNYADYMQTAVFASSLDELIHLSNEKVTAIMCAEAVPWRCHRSLVGDALLVRGINVQDIISRTSTQTHKLTPFAVISGTKITYPKDTTDDEK